MKCPHCQVQNPASAHFCFNCGAMLVGRCANCQAELLPGARFCMNCGAPVPERNVSGEAGTINYTAAAPAPLVQKVRAAAGLSGERRTVTAMFVDIVGSSALARQTGERIWKSIVEETCDISCAAIYRYEGTIARMQGDELLAFFGAPVAHEDDPVRAVRTALELLEAFRGYAQGICEKYDLDFGVRISLSTGPVVIGPIGENLQYEYSAMGGTLNAAAKIEATKRAMSVLISDDTFRYVAPFFDCLYLGEYDSEGQEKGVRIYQVQGPKVDAEKDPRLAGFESPMVGRDAELAYLVQLSQTLDAGLGRVVQVVGETGVGKTRLVAEWKRAVSEVSPKRPIRWVQAQNHSYHLGQAYHLLIDLLHSLLGVPAGAGEPEKRAALRNLIEELYGAGGAKGVDAADLEVYAPLGRLLSLKLEGAALERVNMLDPEGLRAQVLAAMRRLLLRLSGRGALIVVLNNIQWADPSSTEVLTNIIPLASTLPILFCLVTRPVRDAPGWNMVAAAREAMGGRFTQLVLKPLSEDESWQLVCNMLKSERLPAAMRAPILSRAEGNPLYIEEVLHMLVERGAFVQTDVGWALGVEIERSDIPDSLHALLLARIDGLSEAVKYTLRVASVVGRQFPARVLERVMGPEESSIELINYLGALESAGLVHLAQVTPELSYAFQSALVQEVAYNSLLGADRRRLHKAVGKALEDLYPERLASPDMAARLGQHYYMAGDTGRAFNYFKLAGEAALASYANREAETRFRQALPLARSDSERVPLLFGLGRALKGQSRNEESIQVWRETIQILRGMGLERGDELAQLYALMARATWQGGNTPESLNLCQEGLEVIAGTPESPGLANLVHETARAYLFNGFLDEARRLCQQALEMAERMQLVDLQANALATMGLFPDQPTEAALEALTRAVEIAESADLLSQAARAHTNLAANLANRSNDYLRAREHYRRAAELRRLKGSKAGELLSLGGAAEISLTLGDLDDAQATFPILREILDEVVDPGPAVFHFRKIEALLNRYRGNLETAIQQLRVLQSEERQRGNLQNLIEVNSHLVESLLEANSMGSGSQALSWEEAEDALEEARAIGASGIGEPTWLLCLSSMMRTLQGRLGEAQELLEQAGHSNSLGSAPANQGWLAYAQAKLRSVEGVWAEALLAYEAALGTFTQLQMRWWRARVIQELAQMYTTRNLPVDYEQAIALLREAQASFDAMGVTTYSDMIKDKLHILEVKSYAQARAHQKVAQEMAWAGKLQGDFIPKESPQIPGWQVAAVLEPARETSGDFYDFIPLPDGRWGIVIADVTDKGVGAALYMTLSHTLIRTFAGEFPGQPEQVLTAVNRRMLADTPANLFVTAIYGILDPESGTFLYANAGHNPPYHLGARQGKPPHALTRTGMALGIFDDKVWENGSVQLAPGDVLILYTDGIVEAQNADEAFYGKEGLLACAQANLGASAEQLQEAILADVKAFCGDAAQGDDLTLVILVRTHGSDE